MRPGTDNVARGTGIPAAVQETERKMQRNGIGVGFWSAVAVAVGLALLVPVARGTEETRPRVVFDRPGGFAVRQGEEATLSATLEGGSGGVWFWEDRWESDNGGHVTGRAHDTFVIDTRVPGLYWVKAVGSSDGTDGEFAGKIRFRVVPAAPAAAREAKAARDGGTPVWSEDFSTLSGSGSTAFTEWNGWTGNHLYNGTNCLKIGNYDNSGWAQSPPVALNGTAGRAEFALSAFEADSTAVACSASTDGGSSWTVLTNCSPLSSPATVYSVPLAACNEAALKWEATTQGARKRFHLGSVAVYAEPQPPIIDFSPESTEVEVFLGNTYSMEVTATDPEGGTIDALSAESLPPGASWSPPGPGEGSVSGLFEWTPGTTGTWSTVFSAVDKDGTNSATVVFSAVEEGPGTLSFASEMMNVRESSGRVTLTVVRTGGAAGEVSVAWATTNGTAASGVDYSASGGTLAFADGQTEASLAVVLLDDIDPEENKTFSVALSSPLGGAVLGTPASCAVTIMDDDAAGHYYSRCYGQDGLLLKGAALKAQLNAIVNENAKTNAFGSGLNPVLRVTDACPTNGSQVQCIYLQRGIDAASFDKEHLWPQSHGCDVAPQQGDLHHLRPSDPSMNRARAAMDFDDRQNTSGAKEKNGCWYGGGAWEPPDSAKGDVARAILYMDVRYEGANDLEAVDLVGTGTQSRQLGKLSTLLEWNELDPPDDFERRRNELIYTTYQYNRNPFVDHPQWARAVFDPAAFTNDETVSWTVNVTWQGEGWVNGNSAPYVQEMTNGQAKTFYVAPALSGHWHIGSIKWKGAAQAYSTNSAGACEYTCPAVTNNATLAVAFDPDLAALGTPLWWLEQYGPHAASVAARDWDAAELEDWNDDGVPNWQEYLNGNDPNEFKLRQVTGLAVTATSPSGFTVGWNPLDYADGYRVVVYSTTASESQKAGFENGTVDDRWAVSDNGAAVGTAAALDGTYGLAFSASGAWLVSPPVDNPSSVVFSYKRSSTATAWTLAVDVSTDGGETWSLAVDSVNDATQTAKTHSTDLSAWRGQSVLVRLRDERESGGHARYVDNVTVWTSGTKLKEETTAGTSWTATGLEPKTDYDVKVRGEATTLGVAIGPWSGVVRVKTGSDTAGQAFARIMAAEELEPGEYVITGEKTQGTEFAMANQATASYINHMTDAVTFDKDGAICNPDSSIVWTLAGDGEGGWTLYNAEEKKYAGYPGSGNTATLTNKVVEKSRWTISDNGNGLFVVRNVSATNRILKFNSSQDSERFACYTNTASTSNTKLLKFYKRSKSQTPEDPYEAWLAGFDPPLSAADYPANSVGANGHENWKNYVWDISPTDENALEVTDMASGADGALVLTVPMASPNRRYWWVHWSGFKLGSNPLDDAEELDLGPGSPNMTIPNGVSVGGFGLLKTTLE